MSNNIDLGAWEEQVIYPDSESVMAFFFFVFFFCQNPVEKVHWQVIIKARSLRRNGPAQRQFLKMSNIGLYFIFIPCKGRGEGGKEYAFAKRKKFSLWMSRLQKSLILMFVWLKWRRMIFNFFKPLQELRVHLSRSFGSLCLYTPKFKLV